MNTLPTWIACLSFTSLLVMVVARVSMLRRLGVNAVKFGQRDKSDFLIPPFALFYIYLLLISTYRTVTSGASPWHPMAAWVGASLCLLAVVIFLWGLVSFGRAFRIGIDADQPGALITSGAFAFSRNPLYVAFILMFLGILLTFGRWEFLLYLAGALWLIHRQILREEEALREIYGEAYADYTRSVRRYI